MKTALVGTSVFDGTVLHSEKVVVFDGDRIESIQEHVPQGAQTVRLGPGILLPGMIDLQVNGGGGLMVDWNTDAKTLAAICATHARLGATSILPTLITDTADAMDAVISAGIAAIGTPGFLGLHLEGPHLDPRRKGAHDPALIRPMSEADLERLIGAAEKLPVLMVTLAPASVSTGQIERLRAAGVIVSLGHSECTAQEARSAIDAGAQCATHLFNAMSQIGNREPGLAGTVLTSGLYAGLIADGIHVHPDVMRIALGAKPDRVFLVSDCMAAAGTEQTEFLLGGRLILRKAGRLTLEDGTLAGADLTLPRAIQVLVAEAGISLDRALAMATRVPAELIGRKDLGRIAEGCEASFVHLSADFELKQVWQRGVTVR